MGSFGEFWSKGGVGFKREEGAFGELGFGEEEEVLGVVVCRVWIFGMIMFLFRVVLLNRKIILIIYGV